MNVNVAPTVVPGPGSSVGTSVRLKSGRSAVRPRPWPPPLTCTKSLDLTRIEALRMGAGLSSGLSCLVPGLLGSGLGRRAYCVARFSGLDAAAGSDGGEAEQHQFADPTDHLDPCAGPIECRVGGAKNHGVDRDQADLVGLGGSEPLSEGEGERGMTRGPILWLCPTSLPRPSYRSWRLSASDEPVVRRGVRSSARAGFQPSVRPRRVWS